MFNKLNLPRTVTALSVSLLLSFSAQAVETNSSSVQQPSNSSTSQETTVVEFGPYKVNVPRRLLRSFSYEPESRRSCKRSCSWKY